MNNYTFLDASASVQTAASSVVSGAQQPLVQISSMLFPLSVSIGNNPSVATLQGTNPWVVITPGSVIAVSQNPSIVGTYLEDAPSADGDRGIFVLGIRNDTVSSLVSADKDYGGMTTDSAGRTLTKPYAPNEAFIFGVASTLNTNPSSLLAGAGAGLRNYITDIMVSNSGSVATLVSFRDGDASIIGRTIAPATGGSNHKFNMPMRTGGFNQPIEYTAGTATSVLNVVAYGYKAQ